MFIYNLTQYIKHFQDIVPDSDNSGDENAPWNVFEVAGMDEEESDVEVVGDGGGGNNSNNNSNSDDNDDDDDDDDNDINLLVRFDGVIYLFYLFIYLFIYFILFYLFFH